MQAFGIISAAINDLVKNPIQTFYITFFLVVPANIVLGLMDVSGFVFSVSGVRASILVFLVVAIISLVAFANAAFSWHQYALQNVTWRYPLLWNRSARAWSYIASTLKIMLIYLVLVILLALIIGFAFAANFEPEAITEEFAEIYPLLTQGFIVLVYAITLVLFGATLPAVAIDQRISLVTACKAAFRNFPTALVLIGFLLMFSLAIGWLDSYFVPDDLVLQFISWNFVLTKAIPSALITWIDSLMWLAIISRMHRAWIGDSADQIHRRFE